jgi:CheY-like chemotaxis protein
MPASKKRLIFSRASGMFLPGMKESLLLLLSCDGDEFRLLKDAFHGTSVRLVAMADASMAIAEAGVSQPDLLVVGPSVRSIEARWFLERIMANPALRDIPMVMMFYEVRRSWVLEMIKLGLRAYLMLPREKDDLRRRLIQHLPAARIPAHARVGLPKPRESVGERLRQRIAKRQLEQAAAQTSPAAAVPVGKSIKLVEQQFVEESGLMIRSSRREISLFEKIDDYLLRLGGSHSHLVGIFVNLLFTGKVRVAFRNKMERLSLLEGTSTMAKSDAIQLIDDYLNRSNFSLHPDTNTQKIIM